ncbi:MAG: hypothetical protein NTX24_04460 [Candidatus Pacearchaeota archaeon]|nr:hypothetical protein [Candidatus Pacearchaeota archaeon]
MVPTPSSTNPGNRIDNTNSADLIRRYESRFQQDALNTRNDYSKEYEKFRRETLKNYNWYEKACKNIGKSFSVKLNAKEETKLQRDLSTAHLEIKPREASGFAWFVLLMAFFLSFLICAAIYLLTDKMSSELLLFFMLLVFVSIFLYYNFSSMPSRIAQKWRLKASSQMVPCILYIVVYMRHTSNLERAIGFAADHLQPPLSLDLKKIFWDVQTAKFSTIKDALDGYLDTWRDFSPEFIEAFHMVESSLYEPEEERRISILEKALQIILDGVYEKMLHFSHDIRTPITNIYMLGIVLPTLALALLPLASTLLGGLIRWYHVILLFNIILPFMIFYMTNNILAKRPGGFGETELLERNPNYHYYTDNSAYSKAFLIAFPFFILGILPLLFQFLAIPLGLQQDYTFSQIGLGFIGNQTIFGFVTDPQTQQTVGPFGLGALLLSLCIPLSIALFFIISYKLKTEKLVKTREQTKKLEKEFSGSIFQIGNRLADGVPAEMVFGKVAYSTTGTSTAGFFSMVNSNIQRAGMSVEDAIFSPSRGAANFYPSDLLKTSMQILVEAVKKGLGVAAKALMSISEYVKNIHKVDERLRDLLADILSEMKSNMTFLAPLLAAIVIGLSSMITLILGRLKDMLSAGLITADQSVGGMGSISTITEMFDVVKMIPPYWLQVSIGLYIIEVIFILTMTLVTIQEGEDRLGEKYEISKTLSTGITLYLITALISIIALAALASVAISGLAG